MWTNNAAVRHSPKAHSNHHRHSALITILGFQFNMYCNSLLWFVAIFVYFTKTWETVETHTSGDCILWGTFSNAMHITYQSVFLTFTSAASYTAWKIWWNLGPSAITIFLASALFIFIWIWCHVTHRLQQ